MDFLNNFLAKFFDQFKANNPTLAAVVMLVLGLFIYAANNGLADLIGYDLAKLVEWTSIILGFMTGSRTTAFLLAPDTTDTDSPEPPPAPPKIPGKK